DRALEKDAVFARIINGRQVGVGNLSPVLGALFYVKPTAGIDSSRVFAIRPGDGQQQRGELVVEQVSGNASAISPVLSETKEVPRIVRDFEGQPESPSQPHVPIDVVFSGSLRPGSGINQEGRGIEVGHPRVAIVPALRPGDFPDATSFNRL